ncbi:hypothetical protein ABEB36_013651 [Hypothenemus hampei]|uniref:THAP-type domain-containing protein n=1 Tax=Hypothenemus hampei TaxID=57062 RepID=A0ABD1E5S9_HYPHA
MPNCAISTCKNYSRVTKNSGVRYFGFPTEENFAKQWVKACYRRDKINVKNARVCSIHFSEDCFEIPLRQRLLNYQTTNSRVLKFDAVPTLHLPKTPVQKEVSLRSLRMAKKKQILPNCNGPRNTSKLETTCFL